jgi:cytochrome c5
MLRLIWIVITGICVVSCAPLHEVATETTLSGAESPAEQAPPTDMSAMTGESAYYIACASCHETGTNDAPLTGDPESWSDRSPLWQAVLADHANNGYMNMPAKGGRVELPDEVVTRAVEYMMSLTYPERLPD